MTTQLLTWPERLPESLDALYAKAAEQLGAQVTPLAGLEEVSTRRSGERDVLVAVIDAALVSGQTTPAEVVSALSILAHQPDLDLVAIVSDGYIGSDATDVGHSLAGAATISALRSMAVRKGTTCRANVVCVPEAMFGIASTQRGPLAHTVDVDDVVAAVTFLLGSSGTYLNGQVLFVDGGRHLFSSMTA